MIFLSTYLKLKIRNRIDAKPYLILAMNKWKKQHSHSDEIIERFISDKFLLFLFHNYTSDLAIYLCCLDQL